ncbi:MAG: hypothetical protein AAF385_10405, partial [Pseudomonadota bacterium]
MHNRTTQNSDAFAFSVRGATVANAFALAPVVSDALHCQQQPSGTGSSHYVRRVEDFLARNFAPATQRTCQNGAT